MPGSGRPRRRSVRLAQARRRVCPLLAAAVLYSAPLISPARADPLADTAEHYRPLMVEQIDQSLSGARLLRERIAAGDVDGAKTAWVKARIGWERAEVFTSGFVPDLD